MTSAEYMREWRAKRPLVSKKCARCGDTYTTRSATAKYCGWSCARPKKTSVTVSCAFCDKIYFISKSTIDRGRGKYCSASCSGRDHTGERASNWRGGRTSLSDRLRTSQRYKEWRKSVFERDGYKCVECGDATGGNLEADHIKPRYVFPELTFDVDNGRTLCASCHKATDTWGTKVFKYAKSLAKTL